MFLMCLKGDEKQTASGFLKEALKKQGFVDALNIIMAVETAEELKICGID